MPHGTTKMKLAIPPAHGKIGWLDFCRAAGMRCSCVNYIFSKSKLEEQSMPPHQIVMETIWSGVVGR
jgi:hypothetical protein